MTAADVSENAKTARQCHQLAEGWTVRPAARSAAVPHAGAVSDANPALWPLVAEVPGCVHADLLRNGVIADPFLDRRELDVQWVGETDWEYRLTFDVAASHLEMERADLVFDGLDTLASISLNGIHLADTENMHRTYRFDVGRHLRSASNELVITFRSAIVEAERRRAELGYWPSASFDETYNYIRKMAASWGWDWGPKLNTCGIWRPAVLEFWSSARLGSVRPDVSVDEHDIGVVIVHANIERTAPCDLVATVSLTADGDHGPIVVSADVEGDADRLTVVLDAGSVRRWWPRGRGAQPLYDLSLTLAEPDGRVIDRWSRRIGFRTVVLDQSGDAIGSSFRFVVNGDAVFVRGVNWIPDDPLVSRVSPVRYRERLSEAVELGVDLVRVWGGGIYESDIFYDLCDELGLMVWQDFLFACAAYPEAQLQTEVVAEVTSNIERIRTHPSLVVWNGNNENVWGFVDWGWQDHLQGRPWGRGWYDDTLPTLVAELDPGRPYSTGSPSSGDHAAHPNADEYGTVHDWRVWNEVDYRYYRDRVPRFVSEFGWQAPATWSTISEAISDRPLSPDSPGMLHHQKAADGFTKLNRGLEPFFDVPDDFDSWLWATQLNQARAIRTGVEHYRSHRGRCMGTILWQLNDCWPAISWAVLDSSGRRKPGWYALRDAYAPQLLTIQPRGDRVALVAVNDGRDPWHDNIDIVRADFDGTTISARSIPISLAGNHSITIDLPHDVTMASDRSRELIRARSNASRSTAFWFFEPDRDLRLPVPNISVRVVERGSGHVRIECLAHTLVRDLSIFPDRIDPTATIDRQLVTLLPGDVASFVISRPDLDANDLASPPVLFTANHLVAARLRAGNDLIGEELEEVISETLESSG